jgi:lipopolysaccharide export system permease protein
MAGLTLDRYIGWRLLRAVFGVFATVFLLVFALDFVELVRRAGDSPDARAGTLALLAAYRTPSIVERIFPFAVLLGAMIALLTLSRRLELVVVRSSGMSVWRFLMPGIVVAVFVGVITVLAFNPLAASFRERGLEIEARLFPKAAASSDSLIWLRQNTETGYGVIRAAGVLDAGATLTDPVFFLFHRDGRFRERIEADTARLSGLQWRLSKVRHSPVDRPAFEAETATIATNLRPDFIRRSFTPADSVSFWRLRREAADNRSAGLDATLYDLQFQRLLAQPLLFVAMVILASTVSLRLFRMGGVAQTVLLGVSAGFVLYVVKKFVEDLGAVGILGTGIAAWSPALFGSMVGCLVLLHQEDG